MTFIKKHSLFCCIAALALVTIARVVHLLFAPDLFFDEAQYWTWSQAMDWGFYSKPPMVASWIWVTTQFCGDTEFCIRLSSPILHSATALIVYLIGRTLYSRKDGVWSALIYLTLPAVSLSSSLISTDPSLLFFWALSMLFFIRAIKKNKWKYWLACGATAGLGMLSKYSMAFFLPSVVLYLATHQDHRRYFFEAKLWVAGVLASIIFLPNILWNIDNHFVSFLHTQDNANLTGSKFNPDAFLEFFGAQFAVFGPLLFLVLINIFFTIQERLKTNHAGLLLSFILPFLLTIFVLSFISRAHANWAAPVYIPATILVTHWLLTHARFRWILYVSLGLHTSLFIAFLFFNPITKNLDISLAGKKAAWDQQQIRDPFLRLRGWSELGEAVLERASEFPETRLITVSRKTHAYLRYYAKPYADNAIKWNTNDYINDHYELTTSLSDDASQAYLLVSEWEGEAQQIIQSFHDVRRLAPIEIQIYPDYTLSYDIYYLQHYRNGEDQ